METQNTFKLDSATAIKSPGNAIALEDNISRYDTSVRRAELDYSDLELAKKRAGYIRYKALNGLEKYLIEFEANFEHNGGKVIWAQDIEEAQKEIVKILKKYEISSVSKSKTLVADEIRLSEAFERESIEYNEVNPGEYILSLLSEKPRHQSSFLIHKSQGDLTKAFSEKLKLSKNSPVDMLNYVKTVARRNYITAGASITGANYLIADTGSVCITDDSCDSTINSIAPGIQIVIAGIDKIIPSITNLESLLSLYGTYYNGQKINSYNTIISGPRQESEVDGPSEMFVVLIDNGRSKLLEQKRQRRALSCIDCGACHNACPVYRKIGGNAYNTTYTGPIGSVISMWMNNIDEFAHLSYASTLCGKCTEVCPVAINLHELLISNRNDIVKMKIPGSYENLKMLAWQKAFKSRKWMDWRKTTWKNLIVNRLYFNSSNGYKAPEFKEKNFKQLWEERREGKSS